MASKFIRFNSVPELLTWLTGTIIVSSETGTGAALGTDFSDAVGTPFADVVAGDSLEIAGDGCYTVASVTDDNNIVLSSPLDTAYTADADYRITRDAKAMSDFTYFSVYGQSGSKFVGIYEGASF